MTNKSVQVFALVALFGCGDGAVAGPSTAFPDSGVVTSDAGLDPLRAPPQCSSDEYWTRGNHESERMNPGLACIDCHTRGVPDDDELEHGPRFSVAGTVYATGHEPDTCFGVDGPREDVVVEVTDASGRTVRLEVNDAGNFYREGSLTYPITARVLYQGRVRAMLTPQATGDCNSCHTEDGSNAAPGRIVLP
jgi:hypothetical protein